MSSGQKYHVCQLDNEKMEFEFSVSSLECSIGRFASVTFTPKASNAEILLAESASRAKSLNLLLVLDVSGSMENNMQSLINSSLAAIDLLEDLNYVQVITFDVSITTVLERTQITSENRDAIKKQVRLNIVNRGLCTNLEEPLYLSLQREDQNILLISDGFANRGEAKLSCDLISMVRSLQNYTKNKFHCLGLQIQATDLNGTLLQTMASDTDGTYILAHDNDAISTFLGDVITNHLMVRFSECNVSLLEINQDRQKKATQISSAALTGFSLRADRATTHVFDISNMSAGATALTVNFSGSQEPLEYLLLSKECDVRVPSDDETASIFKALASIVLQEPGAPRVNVLLNDLNIRIQNGQSSLEPIVDTLNAVLMPSLSEAGHSNLMYSLSASSNQETDVVHHMRASSRMASQSQSDPS